MKKVIAMGKWVLNEDGQLEPADEQAREYKRKSDEETFYCLFERGHSA